MQDQKPKMMTTGTWTKRILMAAVATAMAVSFMGVSPADAGTDGAAGGDLWMPDRHCC
ncbi:MAG: hypothetical protein ACRD2C_05295 [Acidimicrobiales bacterium]